ncbi:hypothetical protein [Powai lake megavirus]|uniref:Minor capsid protein P9 transmembrane helices domain-containing protein n=1 Tax=Powai lake megavirus TaxID=1842663 RepID=A0A167RCG2_9VIRU|nr:hypothetical protein QJ849_gp367 [Powai lake megavirus]ANB50529.1 hypothetical protein [Powai lake megavirus]
MTDNNYRNNDVFWIYDPMILFSNNNWYKIIPTSNMTQIEALNAMTRLFIYLLILSALLSLVVNYAYALIIAIVVIIIIYFVTANTKYNFGNYQENFGENNKNDSNKNDSNKNDSNKNDSNKNDSNKNDSNKNDSNKNDSNNCKIPKHNNPFMNFNQLDSNENTNKLPVYDSGKDDMQEYFGDDIQISMNEKNDRQFYTTPVTTIPNKQTNFAKWLYDLPETCKENQLYCLRYEDVRFSRYNPDLENNII